VIYCLHLILDAQSYPRHVLGTTITSLTLNLTPNLTYLEISERNVEKCWEMLLQWWSRINKDVEPGTWPLGKSFKILWLLQKSSYCEPKKVVLLLKAIICIRTSNINFEIRFFFFFQYLTLIHSQWWWKIMGGGENAESWQRWFAEE